jgi:hypothetical protein
MVDGTCIGGALLGCSCYNDNENFGKNRLTKIRKYFARLPQRFARLSELRQASNPESGIWLELRVWIVSARAEKDGQKV